MISRRTAKIIAELYETRFRKYHSGRRLSSGYFTMNIDAIYDYLFENDYPAWFCNAVKSTYTTVHTRKFKEFMMRIHTGESLAPATNDWTWKQREMLGQELLINLARDILNFYKGIDLTGFNQQYESKRRDSLLRSLEVDGYIYKDTQLLIPESDVLDVEEETKYIHSLYIELELGEKETAFHHLELSETHYIEEKWDDSISNSRKFLESVLREVANKHNKYISGDSIPEDIYKWPVKVRTYLETAELIETKEKEAIASIYGLLSETGGHPYMAISDQARLLRHLSLTIAQFVMLRLKGKITS